jgi:hypothetical protein
MGHVLPVDSSSASDYRDSAGALPSRDDGRDVKSDRSPDEGRGILALAAAGRRIDAPGTPSATRRFPVEAEARVARDIADVLQRVHPDRVIASGACGADILIHEAAVSLGLQRYLILPFPVDAFRQRSVTDRGGKWGERFDALLETTDSSDLIILNHKTPTTDAQAAQGYRAVTTAIIDAAEEGRAGLRGILLVWERSRQRSPDDETARLAIAGDAQGWKRYEVFTA